MPYRLTWSAPALLDVQRLYRVMASKNIDAAKRAVNTFRRGLAVIGQQPGAGRPIEDLPGEFREWVIEFGDSAYLARYRVAADEVVILALRSQREAGYD